VKFSNDELTVLERVLEYTSMDEDVSDRLYNKFAKIVERVALDIKDSAAPPTQRRMRSLPLTKD
jgi:hypothetical protein